MKKSFILLVCCAILLASFAALCSCGKVAPKDYGALKYFSYYRGGGMDGGSYSLEVTKSEGGGATMELTNCEYYGADEIAKTVSVTDDILSRIDSIAKEHDIYSWSECPESTIEVLDAPSTSVSFWFESGESSNFSDSKDLPDGAWSAVSEITTYIEELLESETQN